MVNSLSIDSFFEGLEVRVMVFNATFNNISAILWHSILLYTGVPEENHIMLYRVPSPDGDPNSQR